jgi:hypothetical protein
LALVDNLALVTGIRLEQRRLSHDVNDLADQSELQGEIDTLPGVDSDVHVGCDCDRKAGASARTSYVPILIAGNT